jgi:hypothetical protein
MATPAMAQGPAATYDFNLPAQALASALRAYGRITRQQLVFDAARMDHLDARPQRPLHRRGGAGATAGRQPSHRRARCQWHPHHHSPIRSAPGTRPHSRARRGHCGNRYAHQGRAGWTKSGAAGVQRGAGRSLARKPACGVGQDPGFLAHQEQRQRLGWRLSTHRQLSRPVGSGADPHAGSGRWPPRSANLL